jgi:hypothetical protein
MAVADIARCPFGHRDAHPTEQRPTDINAGLLFHQIVTCNETRGNVTKRGLAAAASANVAPATFNCLADDVGYSYNGSMEGQSAQGDILRR